MGREVFAGPFVQKGAERAFMLLWRFRSHPHSCWFDEALANRNDCGRVSI